jgi:hypothetical protein
MTGLVVNGRELKKNDTIHWERVTTCLSGIATNVEDEEGNPVDPDFHCPGEVKVPRTKNWHFPENCTGRVASKGDGTGAVEVQD